MNLATMQSQLYDKLGFIASPQAAVVTRLLRSLNDTQREILGQKGLDRLRRTVLSTASVANVPLLSIPQASVQIIHVLDATSQIVLQEISTQDLRFSDPAAIQTSSSPWAYAVTNLASPVARQPSAAGVLSIVSTAAGDGATKTAYIEGIDSSGNYKTASIALNGITPVAPAGSTWLAITKFYLSLSAGGATTAAGAVSLSDAAANVLSTIPIGYAYARYTVVTLYPNPSAARTYYLDVVIHIEDMANAGDQPYLPEDFHWLLVSGAMKKEYDRRQHVQQAMVEAARFAKGLSDLKLWVRRRSGVALSDRRSRRFSSLGPYFQAGS